MCSSSPSCRGGSKLDLLQYVSGGGFFLFWEVQTWTQYSRYGLTSLKERRTNPMLDLLSTPLLIQPTDSCSVSRLAQPPCSFLQNCFLPSRCPACTFLWSYSIPGAGLCIWQVLNKARVAKVILCFNFEVINKNKLFSTMQCDPKSTYPAAVFSRHST